MWAASASRLPAVTAAAAGEGHRMKASAPRVPELPLILVVVLGALVGAVTVAAFLRLPEFILRAVPGSESMQVEVSRVVPEVLGTAFASPWGAIGALAGGAVAWRRFQHRRTRRPAHDGDASWNPAAP